MLHNVYTVRDRTAVLCSPIFQAVNHGVAARSVVRMMRDIPEYDRDAYVLWFIGTWDDEAGRLVPNDGPTVVDVAIPRFEDIEQRKFGFVEEAT